MRSERFPARCRGQGARAARTRVEAAAEAALAEALANRALTPGARARAVPRSACEGLGAAACVRLHMRMLQPGCVLALLRACVRACICMRVYLRARARARARARVRACVRACAVAPPYVALQRAQVHMRVAALWMEAHAARRNICVCNSW